MRLSVSNNVGRSSWLSGLIAVLQFWPYTLASLPASLLQVALPLFLILGVLVPVRIGGITIASSACNATIDGKTQFSIRTLFVLTAAVAIALAIYDVTSRKSVLHQQAALFSIRLLPMTLAAVWAALMAGFSVWRIFIVASCWILFGCFPEPVVAITRFWGTDIWRQIPTMAFFFVPIATFLHTTILLASLLVIRACGYRLVRPTTDGP